MSIRQEIDEYNQEHNINIQLTATDDIIPIYIYIVTRTQKAGQLYLETLFIEHFTNEDDEDRYTSPKAQFFSFFKIAIEFILNNHIDNIIRRRQSDG